MTPFRIRFISPGTASCTFGLNVRMVPFASTESGMTLPASPPRTEPMVRTTGSRESMRRLTMVWKKVIVEALGGQIRRHPSSTSRLNPRNTLTVRVKRRSSGNPIGTHTDWPSMLLSS